MDYLQLCCSNNPWNPWNVRRDQATYLLVFIRLKFSNFDGQFPVFQMTYSIATKWCHVPWLMPFSWCKRFGFNIESYLDGATYTVFCVFGESGTSTQCRETIFSSKRRQSISPHPDWSAGIWLTIYRYCVPMNILNTHTRTRSYVKPLNWGPWKRTIKLGTRIKVAERWIGPL